MSKFARSSPLIASCFSLGLVACAGTEGPTGPAVSVAVAPLTLPSISDACYRLTVANFDGDTVWQQESICADTYGDGQSAITYIGPCDASLVDGDPQVNTVTLELEDLFDAAGAIDRDTYQNPCGHADNGNIDGFGPCELSFECLENQDVLVEFNLTVMRDANQGFFDIAVNFEDVFCSAKFDSCYAGGQPIELLHGASGREHSAVAAIACTAGAGTNPELVLGQPVVVCDLEGQTAQIDFTLDLGAASGGNATATATTTRDLGEGELETTTYTLPYAVYFGLEDLTCGSNEEGPISCGKAYYNLAMNLEALAGQGPVGATIERCQFYYGASAADADGSTFSAFGALQDTKAVYPWISFNGFDGVEIVNNATPSCFANPLNGEGSEVQTGYMKGAAYGTGEAGLEFTYWTHGDRATRFNAQRSIGTPFGFTGNEPGTQTARQWACKATGGTTAGSACNCCERRGSFTITSNCHDGTISYGVFGGRYCNFD